jgi:hypothetical protein
MFIIIEANQGQLYISEILKLLWDRFINGNETNYLQFS